MTKELSKNLMCIVIRGGIEIWVEADKLPDIEKGKEQKKSFILNGELINSADIVGVFKATTMEEFARRKNGQWKCDFGFWHDRFEKCGHTQKDTKEYREKISKLPHCKACNDDESQGHMAGTQEHPVNF